LEPAEQAAKPTGVAINVLGQLRTTLIQLGLLAQVVTLTSPAAKEVRAPRGLEQVAQEQLEIQAPSQVLLSLMVQVARVETGQIRMPEQQGLLTPVMVVAVVESPAALAQRVVQES
jgi:hypothetical protein